MKKILASIGIATCLISLLPLLTAQAKPAKVKSFAEWCQQIDTLPAATKHTIEVLLEKAETKDCQVANSKLTTFTKLEINDDRIVDLGPLDSLTSNLYV